MISFNEIPADLYTPGVYFEFDNSLAAANNPRFKMLGFGQKLATGTAAADVPLLVTSEAQANAYYGIGSMAARMCIAMLKANRAIDLWFIPMVDGAGSKAAGSITFASDASNNGVLYVKVGGDVTPVAVSLGDTPAQVATAVAAALTANGKLMVSAAVDGSVPEQVNVTAKNAGLLGNELVISAYFGAAITPTAPSVTLVQPTGGSGVPDVASAIAAMGDVWYNWLAWPYTDAASMSAIEAELLERWGPMRQIGARGLTAYRGNHTEAATFGNSRNSQLMLSMGSNESPEPSHLVAATLCAVYAKYISIDPAQPLKGRVLLGRQTSPPEKSWSQPERNILLQDGISTHTATVDGQMAIDRLVTMYQLNTNGDPDESYLDPQTLETLERIRFEQRAYVGSTYANYKLANDGERVAVGQKIMTPSIMRTAMLSLYQQFIDRGWCQDFEGYAADLVLEVDIDQKTRLNMRDVPRLVRPFHILAGKTSSSKQPSALRLKR